MPETQWRLGALDAARRLPSKLEGMGLRDNSGYDICLAHG